MVYTGAPKSLCSSIVYETLLFKILKFNCMCVYTVHLCDNTFFEFTFTSIWIKILLFFQSRCSETLCVLWEALPWGNGYPDLPTSSNERLFYGRQDKMIYRGLFCLFLTLSEHFVKHVLLFTLSVYLFSSHFPTFMLGP